MSLTFHKLNSLKCSPVTAGLARGTAGLGAVHMRISTEALSAAATSSTRDRGTQGADRVTSGDLSQHLTAGLHHHIPKPQLPLPTAPMLIHENEQT